MLHPHRGDPPIPPDNHVLHNTEAAQSRNGSLSHPATLPASHSTGVGVCSQEGRGSNTASGLRGATPEGQDLWLRQRLSTASHLSHPGNSFARILLSLVRRPQGYHDPQDKVGQESCSGTKPKPL